VLRHFAGTATFAAGIRAAWADDRPLDALMGEVDHGNFGQTFDQASRTVHMPKATIPMLSPGTAEATRRAVETYDGIVARGGWPEVSKVLELRLGTRHESVVELRSRLTISGDLDPNASAVENDIYDSYLEEAVRRFQARHGLTIDGIVHRRRLTP
jgi:murein L,D-transpeptidase YcbB/YkuD